MKTQYWHGSYSRNNSKSNWKAIGIPAAFKPYLDYSMKVPAFRLFYQAIEKVLRLVYHLCEVPYDPEHAQKIKAQLAICYSTYPSGIAFQAAFAHSAIVQYKKLTNNLQVLNLLHTDMSRTLEIAGNHFDEKIFESLFKKITAIVNDRLVLEELSKSGLQKSIEAYRFYLASSCDLKFETVSSVLRSVIVFGDILPSARLMHLHPFTERLLNTITSASEPYYAELLTLKKEDMLSMGERWVKDLSHSLAKFLPHKEGAETTDIYSKNAGFLHSQNGLPQRDVHYPGLNKPIPPSLDDNAGLENLLRQALSKSTSCFKGLPETGNTALPPDQVQAAKDFAQMANSIFSASAAASKFDGLRTDILNEELSKDPFGQGPIEGTATEGNEIELDLGALGKVQSQIFEQVVDPSFNESKIEALHREASPLAAIMKKNLMPNKELQPEPVRFVANGMLDSARLPQFKFASSIFKRFENHERLTKKGRPVVVIACDASGSMGSDKMHMLRILVVAWLLSILKSSVQLLAALYNDGLVDKNRSGPLIRWLFHPKSSSSKKEAVSAVANLPNSGAGNQQDALSLGFLLNEALKLSRGKRIYLIHLTDCGFINSFSKGLTAEMEVITVLSQFKKQHPGTLHFTLVALGISSVGEIGKLADHVILLPAGELQDSYAAAAKIGTYVSECLKETQHNHAY